MRRNGIDRRLHHAEVSIDRRKRNERRVTSRRSGFDRRVQRLKVSIDRRTFKDQRVYA